MSHYLYRNYNNLPNYYGYAYTIPQTAAWANYTVPFWTPPGDFYQPHYYYPRNDFNQSPTVTCQQTYDNRYCPTRSEVVTSVNGMSVCSFSGNSRNVSSTQSLAECEDPNAWPAEYVSN
jgi:hypothetical protein